MTALGAVSYGNKTAATKYLKRLSFMREEIRYNSSTSSNNFWKFLPLIIEKARNGVPDRKRLQDYIGLSGFCWFQLRLRSTVHKTSLWAICFWSSFWKLSTFRYPLQNYSHFFVRRHTDVWVEGLKIISIVDSGTYWA